MAKKTLLFILLLPLFSQAQQNPCIFSEEAIRRIQNGERMRATALNRSEPLNALLSAASDFEWVLRENPLCEDVYFELAEIYISAGWHDLRHFSTARSHLNRVRGFSSNQAHLAEANRLLNRLASEEQEAREMHANVRIQEQQLNAAREAEARRIQEARAREAALREAEKDFWPFFTIGPGFGQSYGQMGIRASAFIAADNAWMIQGGLGKPISVFEDNTVPLLWSIGLGMSFGSWRRNYQLILQYYGNIEWKKDHFENALGLVFAMNFDLFRSNIGLNIDVGYYLTIQSDNIIIRENRIAEIFGLPGIGIPGLGLSVGLFYKF